MNKKIYLDSLPRKGNYIDWINSVGCEVKFEYKNIKGIFKITDYTPKTQFIKAKYQDKEYKIRTSIFTKCAFGKIFKTELIDTTYKYTIGQKIENNKGKFIVSKRYIDKHHTISRSGNPTIHYIKKYECECCSCGCVNIREEYNVDKFGCNVCGKIPKQVVIGINDITTTDPWMIPYFQGGHEEACQYTANSNKRIFMKCPDCGRNTKTTKQINTLHANKSIKCECKDGISFPNKFSYAFLKQLPVLNVVHEWTIDWLRPYYYDNYFEYNGEAYVLEMDGCLGHGNNIWGNINVKDVDGLKNDISKDNLATSHNISVIRIDAKESSLEYIKNSIINSALSNMFDLSNIDWKYCEEFAYKNIVKVVCKDKEENNLSVKQLSEQYGFCKDTIRKYLKIGHRFNWCHYDGKNEISYFSSIAKYKPIICNNKYIFDSIKTFCQEGEKLFGIKIIDSSVSCAIKNYEGRYKNLIIQYIDKELLDRYKNDEKYIFYENKMVKELHT